LEFIGNDVRQSCFAQPGRAVKQHVIQRFVPLLGGLNEYLNIIHHLLLARKITKRKRAQGPLNLFLLGVSALAFQVIFAHNLKWLKVKQSTSPTQNRTVFFVFGQSPSHISAIPVKSAHGIAFAYHPCKTLNHAQKLPGAIPSQPEAPKTFLGH
jgi:hypothetical protein